MDFGHCAFLIFSTKSRESNGLRSNSKEGKAALKVEGEGKR